MARWLPDTTQAHVFGNFRSLSNLSGSEGRLMIWSAGIVRAGATTSATYGVLANAGNGASANVALAMDGYMEVIAGNNMSPGDFLVPDATGRAAATAVTSNYYYSLRSMGSAASGERVRAAILNPPLRF